MTAKSQIPMMSKSSLPPAAKVALDEVKNLLKQGKPLRDFDNRKDSKKGQGPPLPDPSLGCRYFEKQVGTAHVGDKRPTGTHRLVLEIDLKGREIREVYYSEEHYFKGTFFRAARH
jgi:hypothetical protein